MTVKQLSVLLENSSGSLVRVFRLLKDADIQLISTSLADTADFGICRIICSEASRALEVLSSAGVAVTTSDVFAIELDNRPGAAADAIELFAREGIEISYLYSFLLAGRGVLIFRTDNIERTKDIITQSGLNNIADSDMELRRLTEA